ncbi:hypothetical protein [Vibrio maritimus]|uniref:hypothetical protein n=1 Tax=Vibrio maritimus TaxID=990268 RepID=UPI00373706ED
MGTIFQDPLTLTFSAIIVVFALITGHGLAKQTSKLVKSLRAVTEELNQLKNITEYDEHGEPVETDWTPNSASVAFQNYSKIKSVIGEAEYLRSSWDSYERSMQLPDVDYGRKPGQAPALRNTLQVGTVFNMESIVEPFINVRQFTAIPNILTGAGLLFTFVGLMIGIGEASVGLSSSDIDAAKESLNPLLSGASIAFTTSVVGLICSMLFSWFEKARFHAVEKSVKDFSDYLSSHIEFMDSDKLASLQLEATEAQTKALAGFQLDQQRITDETIRRVSREFRETLLESAGKEIDQMGDVLSQMSENLRQNIDSLTEAQQKTLSATTSLSASLETSVNQLVVKLNSAVGDMAEREQAIITNVENTVQSMTDSLRQQMSEMTNTYQVTMNQISTEFSKIPQQVSALAQQNMRESLEQYHALTDELLPPMLEKVADSLGQQVVNFTQQVKGAESAVADTLSSMPAVMNGFEELGRELSSNVSLLKQLNDVSEDNLDNFSSVLGHLHTASNDLVAASEQSNHSIEKFQSLIEQIRVSAVESQDSNRSIAEATSHLSKVIESQSVVTGQLESSMSKVVIDLKKGLQEYVEHANSQLIDMDDKAANVANNLIDATAEISMLVNDLSSRELRGAVKA